MGTKKMYVIVRNPEDLRDIAIKVEIEETIEITQNLVARLLDNTTVPLHIFLNNREQIAKTIRETIEEVEHRVAEYKKKVEEALEEIKKAAEEKQYELEYESEED
jgi:homoserine dehydrogenase